MLLHFVRPIRYGTFHPNVRALSLCSLGDIRGQCDEDMNDMGENGEAMIVLCTDYELLRWSTLDDEGNQIDRRTLIDCKAS